MSVTRSPDHRVHGLRDGLPGLVDMMDRLLADDGCPWDRAQTLETLKPYLLEETYEVLEAMDDPRAHRGELGDLLFQIVFQSALRQREGAFDLDDVIEGIRSKMLRRHPHVFADPDRPGAQATTPQEVTQQWERIKAEERRAASREGDAVPGGPATEAEAARSAFDGIPRGLPALVRAGRMQDRAAALGFDWPDLEGAVAKLREELGELEAAHRDAEPADRIAEELGDLLFVLVRVAGKLGADPEDALRRANRKFTRRFGHVLRRCDALGLDPAQAGLERLDVLWNEAKAQERDAGPRES